MIVRDDFSRYAWVYFISHESDATEAFEKFLTDLRVEGIPSEVVVVRSDGGGGEFNEGKFGKLCRERNIKKKFTTALSPEYNGVAKLGLAVIESAALVARIQALELFLGFDIPARPSLRTETVSWACDEDKRTATVANPENRSSYGTFYGEIPLTNPVSMVQHSGYG